MAGKDIVGQSMTGSGKTAAFGIPAMEKVDAEYARRADADPLPDARTGRCRCPRKSTSSRFSSAASTALPIYGGQSYERQFFGLKQGAQIVIGTPGRVMDHMRRGTLRLETVKMVILDEADVMLNMGFREDIETILKDAPKERQTVFFSATMPQPDPRPDRKIFARSAEREDRAEGDDRADGRAGLLRSGPPLQNGIAHAAD